MHNLSWAKGNSNVDKNIDESHLIQFKMDGLYFRGSNLPFVKSNDNNGFHINGRTNVSPCGRWAVFLEPGEKQSTCFANGKTRRITSLTEEGAIRLQWFQKFE